MTTSATCYPYIIEHVDFKLHGMQPCFNCCGNKTDCLWYAEQQGRQYGGWRRDGLKKEELRPAACLVYIGCSKSLHIRIYMPVLKFLII